MQALGTRKRVVAVASKFKFAIALLNKAGLPVVGTDGAVDMTAIETLALGALWAMGHPGPNTDPAGVGRPERANLTSDY